ncbi:MAP kinase kinase, variant 2 [Balamuthia mandrillaris]
MEDKDKDKLEEHEEYVGQFQLGKIIGRGGFGTVHKGLNLNTGNIVAIKRFRADKIAKTNLSLIMGEAEILKTLNHSNIVKFYGYVKTHHHLYFVMEYVEEGSLSRVINDFGNFPEKLAAVYIKQVLDGLAYLHSHNVVHRDIKGSNILITKEGTIKLADFGVSATVNESEKRFSVVGTPYWMAPEVIEISGHSLRSDIWSVGCLVVQLIRGEPPYFQQPAMAAMFRIVSDKHPPLPENISDDLADFLLKCWRKDPNHRPSAVELLEHPWIVNAKDTVIALREREGKPVIMLVEKTDSESGEIAGCDLATPELLEVIEDPRKYKEKKKKGVQLELENLVLPDANDEHAEVAGDEPAKQQHEKAREEEEDGELDSPTVYSRTIGDDDKKASPAVPTQNGATTNVASGRRDGPSSIRKGIEATKASATANGKAEEDADGQSVQTVIKDNVEDEDDAEPARDVDTMHVAPKLLEKDSLEVQQKLWLRLESALKENARLERLVDKMKIGMEELLAEKNDMTIRLAEIKAKNAEIITLAKIVVKDTYYDINDETATTASSGSEEENGGHTDVTSDQPPADPKPEKENNSSFSNRLSSFAFAGLPTPSNPFHTKLTDKEREKRAKVKRRLNALLQENEAIGKEELRKDSSSSLFIASILEEEDEDEEASTDSAKSSGTISKNTLGSFMGLGKNKRRKQKQAFYSLTSLRRDPKKSNLKKAHKEQKEQKEGKRRASLQSSSPSISTTSSSCDQLSSSSSSTSSQSAHSAPTTSLTRSKLTLTCSLSHSLSNHKLSFISHTLS